jgi:hypothetical protein
MGRVYKTSQGKPIDMDHIRLKNEDTIAVGNMKVNARGDQLGPGGQVIKGRNQVADQQYRVNSANQQRIHQVQETQRRAGAAAGSGQAQPVIPEVDPSGVPFDPPVTEEVPAEPQLRGSLADSIARSVVVNQELLDPNPNKPKGPQRI